MGQTPDRARLAPGPGHPADSGRDPRWGSLNRLGAFGGVSGAGWCLDTALFALLVHVGGVAAGVANAVSAGTAVLFVFVVTHERVFDGSRRRRSEHLLVYVLCQVLLVLAASWAVGALVALTEVEPLLVKLAVTPGTFLANFVLMLLLTRRRATTPPREPAT